MDLVVLLLVITLAAVIFAARGALRGYKYQAVRALTPKRLFIPRAVTKGRPSFKYRRELHSISIKECETLIRTFDDLLFVIVSERSRRRPLPFYDVRAIAMTPSQLASELRWFPQSSCVVMYGDTVQCSLVLAALEDIPEIPPIYMLRDTSTLWEVA